MSKYIVAMMALLAISLLLAGQTLSQLVAAENASTYREHENNTYSKYHAQRITLGDLGLLQVAAHDLYNVNRTSGIDTEDEKFNLSTLFNYGEENIANGGEVRNSENVVTHTVAVKIAKYYFKQLDSGLDVDEAKEKTVEHYLQKLAKAYQRTFNEKFPQPVAEEEVEEGNRLNGDLALRTLHAFLPATITVNGKQVSILDPSLLTTRLSKEELQQLSRPLDDSFDPVFLNMPVGVDENGNPITINLLEKDRSFGEQFGTDYTFDELMADLADGRYNKHDTVMELLREEFAEGQGE
jgi:hypothetical protein